MVSDLGEFWDDWMEESKEEKKHIMKMLDLIHKEVINRDDRSESGSVQIPIQGQCSGGSCERVDLCRKDGGEKGAGGSGEDPRA
jgi:hypothetical protein